MKSKIEIIETLERGYSTHNFETLEQLMTNDIVVRRLNDDTVIANGKEAVLDIYNKVYRENLTRNKIIGKMEFGNKIVLEEEMTRPDGTVQDAAVCCQFEGDKVQKIWWLLE